MLKAYPAIINLTAVIVLGAIALVLAMTSMLAGIDLLNLGLNDTEYNEAYMNTESCVEHGLYELSQDLNYTGETLSFGSTQCTLVISGSGSSRTLSAEGQTGLDYFIDLNLDLEVGSRPFSITNWEQSL